MHLVNWHRNLAALLAGALAGCKPLPQGDDTDYFRPIRYRLTATVETPQGERSGYSVIETKTNRRITRVQTTGEAVAVDLPGGQVLFVLLRSASMVDWAATAPGVPFPKSAKPPRSFAERQAELEWQLDAVSRDRGIHYLWGDDVPKDRAQYLPYMVRFRDIADPKSVELVAPDNFVKAFGPGYRLTSLTVQVTDESVTSGIETRLPSFKAETGFDDWYKSLPYGDPRRITLDDFRKGM